MHRAIFRAIQRAMSRATILIPSINTIINSYY